MDVVSNTDESVSMPRCISCEQPASLFLRHDKISDMFRCAHCGLIFADPQDYVDEQEYAPVEQLDQLTEEDHERFSKVFSEGIDTSDADGNMYADYGLSQAAMAAGLFQLVRDCIERHTRLSSASSFDLLDIGCATGFLLHEVQQHYSRARVAGVEPSPVSCRKARTLYGLNIHQGTLNTFNPKGVEYDVITIIGNLQLHEDPFATLRRVYQLLKPGGIVIFHTKNPFSAARRLARMAASVPAIKHSRITNLAIERGYLCMRYAASKDFLTRKAEEMGFVTLDVHTIPPRVLAFSTHTTAHGSGLVGRIWKTLDQIDTVLDQRAWIQICCGKPVESGNSGH